MLLSCVYVFFNNTGTSEIYTLSLHDALPILVPWEQMGFARYDARTNEMALIADTALPTGEPSGRFDADVGLTGEAVRLGRPVVARGPRGEPGAGVLPGRQQPGSEVLVPLYHAGRLVGLWSVRHPDPAIYHDSAGDLPARV